MSEMEEITDCPCGTGKQYEECCEPLHDGHAYAQTAEQLMRSRYSAFVAQEIDYIEKTQKLGAEEDFDKEAAESWSEESFWEGLDILHTETQDGKPHVVEFVAKYTDRTGKFQAHHEIAYFEKENNKWIYTDGKIIDRESYRRESPKVGRNDPCPCNSGKKYKKCCGANA